MTDAISERANGRGRAQIRRLNCPACASRMQATRPTTTLNNATGRCLLACAVVGGDNAAARAEVLVSFRETDAQHSSCSRRRHCSGYAFSADFFHAHALAPDCRCELARTVGVAIRPLTTAARSYRWLVVDIANRARVWKPAPGAHTLGSQHDLQAASNQVPTPRQAGAYTAVVVLSDL